MKETILLFAISAERDVNPSMNLAELLLLAVGLSMDASAVSISNALCMPRIRTKEVLRIAGAFGFFQALMPFLGYYFASLFYDVISGFDHWVALLLLLFIGGKMLWEAVKGEEEQECPTRITNKMLLLQAVATSIDALAVGISLSALSVNVWSSVLIIGLVTFGCCVLAMLVGKRFGNALGKRAGILGGLILIGIGLKIFIEHMFFA